MNQIYNRAMASERNFRQLVKRSLSNKIETNNVKMGLPTMQKSLADSGLLEDVRDNGTILTYNGDLIDKRGFFLRLGRDTELQMEELKRNIKKDLTAASMSGGGYTIPEIFHAGMKMYVVESPFLSRASWFYLDAGNTLRLVKPKVRPDKDSDAYSLYGVSVSWGSTVTADDGFSKQENEPSGWEQVQLVPSELSSWFLATQTLIEDSAISFTNALMRLCRQSWMGAVEKACFRGSGAGQNLGIIPDPGTLQVNRTSPTAISFQDLVRMKSKLPQVFHNGSVWFLSTAAQESLRLQSGDDTHFSAEGGGGASRPVFQEVWIPSPTVEDNEVDNLATFILGSRCLTIPDKDRLAALGSSGDIVLSNPANYLLATTKNFELRASMHPHFRNNQIDFTVNGRIDGVSLFAESHVYLTDTVGSS